MCGILAILGIDGKAEALRQVAVNRSELLRHRGPDWSGIWVEDNDVSCGQKGHIIAHERLAIMDVESGQQPLFSVTPASTSEKDAQVVLGVNGEIYNHQTIRSDLLSANPDCRFRTGSDCEVIIPLYQKASENADHGQWINRLRGMFAFVLYDRAKRSFLVVRDHLGIIPLFMGLGMHGNGTIWIASELKALTQDCPGFIEFPPGHYYDSSTGQMVRWWNPPFMVDEKHFPTPTPPLDLGQLRKKFEQAVISHTMSDVPYGVLLSGGLDSSLVAAIAQRHARSKGEGPLHSFAIGLDGSPDLVAAERVARYLGTRHHNFRFTLSEGLDALSSVIYHLETFDVTTVRASTPMYLLSRKIRAMGIKMVLSGEGSDEIFGGYLYFHRAPNSEEFHRETVRKLKALHSYDCLRANKSTSAWGLEVRVPFLDRDFVEFAMEEIDPHQKMVQPQRVPCMEKWILRKAFEEEEEGSQVPPLLPREILWRQKEQFSDGVGYGWIDGLKATAEERISDSQMRFAQFRFPENTPTTKEAFLYRSIFEDHFPQPCARATVPGGPSVACSTASALAWDPLFQQSALQDPSGRSVRGVHQNHS